MDKGLMKRLSLQVRNGSSNGFEESVARGCGGRLPEMI
jgi:hypothetical protein